MSPKNDTGHDVITLMIVDDHAIVRGGIRAFLSAQTDMALVGEASSGQEAVDMAAEHAPDVALVDLVMPGMDGVETTRRIRDLSPSTQVVVLTSYHQDEHIFPAIRAGALSYVLKDIAPEELADVVRRAARREAVLHPRVAARVMQELRGAASASQNPLAALTNREHEVLTLIADGLSNSNIANRLCISQKTVKRHVSNILQKLHLDDRTQAAVYAWRQGLVRND